MNDLLFVMYNLKLKDQARGVKQIHDEEHSCDEIDSDDEWITDDVDHDVQGNEGSDDGNVGSDGPDGVGMDLDVEITNIDVDQEIEVLYSGNVCDNIGSPNQDVFATFEEHLEEDEEMMVRMMIIKRLLLIYSSILVLFSGGSFLMPACFIVY
ncbi:hypothetical protein Drorol1_Dr00019087 [Drosera rotundifolia]